MPPGWAAAVTDSIRAPGGAVTGPGAQVDMGAAPAEVGTRKAIGASAAMRNVLRFMTRRL
ncbi:hypothetical protein GCM10029964_004910 [Kibdelosporangium lantanae]